MKRNKDSKYLITRLYSIDYFYYYSSPVFFSAFFFPFIAKGEARPYLDNELEEKISNIKNNFHGNFYNYATQGFGNIAFDKNLISFGYFYNRLVAYEIEKNKYFKLIDGVGDLESEQTKEEILEALNKSDLMLRRDIKVPDMVKKELMDDLKIHEVKYVLAKILYYIVDEKHRLPDISDDCYKLFKGNFNMTLKKNNVYLTSRKYADFDKKEFYRILSMAKNVQILCHDGISLFGNKGVYRNCNGIQDEMLDILNKNNDLEVEIILRTTPDDDFTEFCLSYKHMRMSKKKIVNYSIESIKEIIKHLDSKHLYLKTTSQSLPYSLVIFTFENEALDFIKLDMYSPFVGDNVDRPSMYIIKKINYEMFEHFKNVFERMWADDNYSKFIGDE